MSYRRNLLRFNWYKLILVLFIFGVVILGSLSLVLFIFPESLINYLNDFFNEQKLSIIATGFKSIIMLHVLSKWNQYPSFNDIIEFTNKKREALLQLALFNRNISGLHGLGALSMANTHEHMIQIRNVMEEIAQPVCQSSLD